MFKLSLTTKRSEKAKVTSPDDYNIIYGNSELRIKVQSDIVFSNLGLVMSYFNSHEIGKNVNDLLGGGQGVKEVKIDSYEYYRLEF